jgi:hypothetical protein
MERVPLYTRRGHQTVYVYSQPCYYEKVAMPIDIICLHAYNKNMATIQYTIRGIPAQVDSRLRRLARLRGQSLNQIVIEQLTAESKPSHKQAFSSKKPTVNTDFDDLFGLMTPLEPAVETVLQAQRTVNPKDWQ